MEVGKIVNITLSEDEVRVIVANHLKSEGYDVYPADIQWSLRHETEDFGFMSSPVTRFAGCQVTSKIK